MWAIGNFISIILSFFLLPPGSPAQTLTSALVIMQELLLSYIPANSSLSPDLTLIFIFPDPNFRLVFLSSVLGALWNKSGRNK